MTAKQIKNKSIQTKKAFHVLKVRRKHTSPGLSYRTRCKFYCNAAGKMELHLILPHIPYSHFYLPLKTNMFLITHYKVDYNMHFSPVFTQ